MSMVKGGRGPRGSCARSTRGVLALVAAAGAGAGLGSSALAQAKLGGGRDARDDEGGFRGAEQRLGLSRLDVMRVSAHGFPGAGGSRPGTSKRPYIKSSECAFSSSISAALISPFTTRKPCS